MKNEPTRHRSSGIIKERTEEAWPNRSNGPPTLYATTLNNVEQQAGAMTEQPWPNRSNGPPALEKNADTYLTKDNILISAASETGYSLLQLYKECLFLSMEKTVDFCNRVSYSDAKEISLNL